jgi:L-arabinose isomerase
MNKIELTSEILSSQECGFITKTKMSRTLDERGCWSAEEKSKALDQWMDIQAVKLMKQVGKAASGSGDKGQTVDNVFHRDPDKPDQMIQVYMTWANMGAAEKIQVVKKIDKEMRRLVAKRDAIVVYGSRRHGRKFRAQAGQFDFKFDESAAHASAN